MSAVSSVQLRVGFSNNSNLEDIARQRGITVPSSARDAPAAQQPQQPTKTIDSVVSQLSLHEMYDIIGHLKELAETKPDELRLLLISHPQIAEAIVQMQVSGATWWDVPYRAFSVFQVSNHKHVGSYILACRYR